MGIKGISRIEEFFCVDSDKAKRDHLLQRIYNGLDQQIFTIDKKADPILYIDDIAQYNIDEGLALSDDEVEYLNEVSQKLNAN